MMKLETRERIVSLLECRDADLAMSAQKIAWRCGITVNQVVGVRNSLNTLKRKPRVPFGEKIGNKTNVPEEEIRACLNCREKFHSEGRFIFMCKQCQEYASRNESSMETA